MVSVGSILGETFGLVGRHRRAIAAWTAVNLVFALLSQWVMRPMVAAQLAASQAGASPQASPALLLYQLATIALLTILYAAAFRAVLAPGDDRFAYLRAGTGELILFATSVVLAFGFLIAMISLMIVAGIVAGLVLASADAANGASAALFATLLASAFFATLMFFAVRVSPAGPLSLVQRNIVIGPAWRLTRGRFWTLLGAYACVFLLIAIAFLLILAAIMPGYWALMSFAGRADFPVRFVSWQVELVRSDSGWRMIALALIGAITGALAVALGGGVVAVATRQLLAERGEPL